MLSNKIKLENNIRNKLFCDSEGKLVVLLVYLNFRAVPDLTWKSPLVKAVNLRFAPTFRPCLAPCEVLKNEPVDPVSIIAWTGSLLTAKLRLTFRLADGRPVLHKTTAVSSSSSNDCCKTAAVVLHTDAQCPALEHLWQVSFLAVRGCCFRPQNWQCGRGLFATWWVAEVPGWSGCLRVVWENSLTAATVKCSALWKDFEKSVDSSMAQASDMQLSMSVLESSRSNSLAQMSSDLSPDIRAGVSY